MSTLTESVELAIECQAFGQNFRRFTQPSTKRSVAINPRFPFLESRFPILIAGKQLAQIPRVGFGNFGSGRQSFNVVHDFLQKNRDVR